MKKVFKQLSLLVVITALISACTEDFNSVESDLSGVQNFATESVNYPVVAYTHKLNPVQSNGLTSNLLGVYNDPNFGQTVASVVTQVTPETLTPDFKYNPVITSVILSIPYSSTKTETDDDGNGTYTLDSVFGSGKIKLTVYRNNYFLRDLDPSTGLEDAQAYYSDASDTNPIDFDAFRGEELYSNDDFIFSTDEVVLVTQDEETGEDNTERLSPRLRVDIKKDDTFWEDLIIKKQGDPVLSTADNFKDYFRGVYFKVEAIGDQGNMAMLDFNNTDASITINYTTQNVTNYTDEDGDGIPYFADVTPKADTTNGTDSDNDGINDDTDVDNVENAVDTNNDGIDDNYKSADLTYKLKFTQNRLNILKDNFNISEGNSTTGDALLKLKGGDGSMVVIDLFGNNNQNLTSFKETFKNGDQVTRLINEAQLEFYVDQSLIATDEPERLYLYDLNNNIQIVDYALDTENTVSPLLSKRLFSTPLEVDESTTKGIKYKIRITEHLNNILLRDSTNTKLGLVVTTNINSVNNLKVKNSDNSTVTTVPSGAVLSPKGTILYGSTDDVPEDKRVKLKIFYTNTEL